MDEESGSEFLDLILPMLKELNAVDTPGDEKIVHFLQPEELEAKLNLQLTDSSRPRSQESLVKLCRDFIRYSVRTSHRGFYNQLYGGVDPYGLAGSWITEALNTSQYTYEVAPCFVLAERAVLNRAKSLFGGARWADADGLFCPGGSYANMLALALARDNSPVNQRSRINTKGLNGAGEMVVYTSEMSHYSLSKSCALLGIGKDNLVKIKCDENGSMLISDLENLLENRDSARHLETQNIINKLKQPRDPYQEAVSLICNGDVLNIKKDNGIQENGFDHHQAPNNNSGNQNNLNFASSNSRVKNHNGLHRENDDIDQNISGFGPNIPNYSTRSNRIPIMINATAGTTVRGAFDDLEKIADICERHNIWMHVDACWGGSLMLSENHKHLLKGIERADSISWNPHKMLGAPLQCSMFLVKKKGLLHKCNSLGADYLFQPDKYYDVSYDTGDMTMQCGRKTDAFKLLLMWLARGEESLSERVDNCMECCQYLRDRVRSRPGYIPVSDGEQDRCTNVCFWYVPECMRDQDRTEEWWDRIHRVTSIIKKKLVMSGTLMIGYAPLPVKIDKPVQRPGKHVANNLKHKTYCAMNINRENHVNNKISHNNMGMDVKINTDQHNIIVNHVETNLNMCSNISCEIGNKNTLHTNINEIHSTHNGFNTINQATQINKDVTQINTNLKEPTVNHFESDDSFQSEQNFINLNNKQNDQDLEIRSIYHPDNTDKTSIRDNMIQINNSNLAPNLNNQNGTSTNNDLAPNSNNQNGTSVNNVQNNGITSSKQPQNVDNHIQICDCEDFAQHPEDKHFIKKVNAFRVVNTCHPPPTFNDMLFILREIERVGHDIVI